MLLFVVVAAVFMCLGWIGRRHAGWRRYWRTGQTANTHAAKMGMQCFVVLKIMILSNARLDATVLYCTLQYGNGMEQSRLSSSGIDMINLSLFTIMQPRYWYELKTSLGCYLWLLLNIGHVTTSPKALGRVVMWLLLNDGHVTIAFLTLWRWSCDFYLWCWRQCQMTLIVKTRRLPFKLITNAPGKMVSVLLLYR